MANVDDRRELSIERAERQRHRVAQRAAEDVAIVELLELVAVIGIVEPVGEVRDEVELVVDEIGEGLQLPGASARPVIRGQAVAMRLATVRRVDEAEAVDLA